MIRQFVSQIRQYKYDQTCDSPELSAHARVPAHMRPKTVSNAVKVSGGRLAVGDQVRGNQSDLRPRCPGVRCAEKVKQVTSTVLPANNHDIVIALAPGNKCTDAATDGSTFNERWIMARNGTLRGLVRHWFLIDFLNCMIFEDNNKCLYLNQ